jgi:acetyltransferase-like isoleucine patch superfamily enzyme
LGVILDVSLNRLRFVSPIATIRARTGGSKVVVFRGTRVNNRGMLRVETGHLSLGSQWPDAPFFSPGYLIIAPGGRLTVNGDFSIHTGMQVVVDRDASLTLGSGYINDNVRISCFRSITIGHDVAISEFVVIRDSDNHRIDGSREATAPIVIGDHVWIGMRATILKGVTIGEGAVVAAGAVVTRDVPARCLVAGVPASVRRNNVAWGDAQHVSA